MHINLEPTDKYSIEAYSDHEIKIDSTLYQKSLIASSHGIISTWPIQAISELNEETLAPLLRHQPKIILIGHQQQGQFAPLSIVQALAKQGIGLECMSISAACSTYNVLLSERREVVVGIIL